MRLLASAKFHRGDRSEKHSALYICDGAAMSANFTILRILSAAARASEYKIYIARHIPYRSSAPRILKFYAVADRYGTLHAVGRKPQY